MRFRLQPGSPILVNLHFQRLEVKFSRKSNVFPRFAWVLAFYFMAEFHFQVTAFWSFTLRVESEDQPKRS